MSLYFSTFFCTVFLGINNHNTLAAMRSMQHTEQLSAEAMFADGHTKSAHSQRTTNVRRSTYCILRQNECEDSIGLNMLPAYHEIPPFHEMSSHFIK